MNGRRRSSGPSRRSRHRLPRPPPPPPRGRPPLGWAPPAPPPPAWVGGALLGGPPPAARRIEVCSRLAPGLREPVRALQLLQAAADRRRLTVVVVDGRIGLPFERLAVGAIELVDELLEW